jgi:hypothetical protein
MNRLVPISYREALLPSTLLHVSFILTNHNRPSTYQLERSSTEHSSTCKPQATKGVVSISYRRALLSTLYMLLYEILQDFLNILGQIVNKIGL